MPQLNERYVTDEGGKRVGVLLGIAEYQQLLAELEELECIRAYDAAKASEEAAVPFDQAMADIECSSHK